MKVFIINGYPGSGKDTFVGYCSKFARVANYVTSTPAKLALKLLGWDGVTKTPEIRKTLAELMEFSEQNFDGVYNSTIINVELVASWKNTQAMFIHCREPRNIERYKKYFNAKTIFIQRNSCKQQYNNNSDNEVEKYAYDIIIPNNGTLLQLQAQAKLFVRGNIDV